MASDRCDYCDGRFDRPGLFGCESDRHSRPDLAQRIVAIVESEVSDRRGLKWSICDEEVAVELRDKLANQIRAELSDFEAGAN